MLAFLVGLVVGIGMALGGVRRVRRHRQLRAERRRLVIAALGGGRHASAAPLPAPRFSSRGR